MSLHALDLTRWNRVSIGLGGTIWLVVALPRLLGLFMIGDLELILFLALCMITPLVIPLVSFPRENRLIYELVCLIIFLQPFATLPGGISLFMSRGVFAAVAATIWLLFTLLIALLGLLLLMQKRGRQLANICLAVAFIYVPIGGVWMVFDRLGIQPLGFSRTTVLLTAVHFHFITLAALIITGLTGRAIHAMQRRGLWKIYRVIAGCMLVNPLLVAAGITVSQVTGVSFLESVGAYLLAFCLISIALFNLSFVVPATTPLLARVLLVISSTAVVFTMLFVCAYILGAVTGKWTITISQMITFHGWVNALVFGLCGLLGWRLKLNQGKE